MKRILLASAATVAATAAFADGHSPVNVGISLGFTGPLESLAGPMAAAAEMAMQEVSDSGALLDGTTVAPVRADSTCIDAAAATAAVERLVTSDGVVGIVGGMCSGETGATLQNVALPNGIVMVSPSATSPGLSTVEDNGLFFRTSPSDARQGVVIAEALLDRGIETVAVTYTNNDYGKGLADAFQASYEERGGSVTINAAHEDGKADYSAEVGALSAAGGDMLVVAGYVDQGGSGIVRAALDTGAFDQFYFPDGMVSQALIDNFGSEIDGSMGANPSPSEELGGRFTDYVGGAFDATEAFAPEAYDAAALIMLAMQASGSTDPNAYKDSIMDVANAPGEEIFPGELEKGLQILADGGEIDYVGASGVELIGPGEAAGSYREITFEGGEEQVVGYR